jgi:pimeloyl-ACP methyl ester carboxylesterase
VPGDRPVSHPPRRLPYDAAATGQLAVEAARACRARLAAAGMELSAYNTSESAADFADPRAALKIASWNVYGVSYGTDLALTYMREHPQGIRSVMTGDDQDRRPCAVRESPALRFGEQAHIERWLSAMVVAAPGSGSPWGPGTPGGRGIG